MSISVNHAGTGDSTIPSIVKDSLLSFAQQQLWSQCQWQQEQSSCGLLFPYRLHGILDIQALAESFQDLIRRHTLLRMTFPTVGQAVVQHIATEIPNPLTIKDMRLLTQRLQETELQQLLLSEAEYPFDLRHGPLARMSIVRLQEQEGFLLFNVHVLVADRHTIHEILQDFATLYTAHITHTQIHTPDVQHYYADGEQEQHFTYWLHALQDIPTVMALPTDYARPPLQCFQGKRYIHVLPTNRRKKLALFSENEHISSTTLLLSVWTALLQRYSGQDNLLIGIDAPRTKQTAEPIPRTQTLPLLISATDQPDFRQLLQLVQKALDCASAHPILPFARVVEALDIQPDASHATFTNVSFAIVQQEQETVFSLPGLEIEEVIPTTCTLTSDLTLTVSTKAEDIVVCFEYRHDLFKEDTIVRMAEHFIRLLGALLDQPDRPVSLLPWLSPAEYALLDRWNATTLDYPRQLLLPARILQQARHAPDTLAAVYADQHLSYAQLVERAHQLAMRLIRLGVQAETLVGIYLERSLDLLIAQLAVMLAGGAYLPLDPALPQERLRFLLEDASALGVLTHRALAAQVPVPGLHILCLDASAETDEHQQEVLPLLRPEQLAYVIYTSGSTGMPKGVQITHANLAHLTAAYQQVYHFTSADRCTHLAGLGFDATVAETWPQLAVGASLWLLDDQTRLVPTLLRDWLLDQQISVSFVPTPLAEELLTLPWPKQVALRILLTAGDVLHRYPPAHLPFQLLNHYGPTECTVATTVAFVEGTAQQTVPPPIGHPLANTHLYVLDRFQQVLPPGIPGELFIGGEGVGRGYHRRADLTREHFVQVSLPDGSSERVYRSGDLVRYLPDGQLEFLGRLDQQVKIRGFRIELGEIEATLLRHDAVREAIVLVHEVQHGDSRLVAFLVNKEGANPTDSVLRLFLKTYLPAYMLPGRYIMLDTLPLTSSGKVDRRALQNMLQTPVAHSITEPPQMQSTNNSPLAQQLTVLWCKLLGLTTVGLHDNFFDLGGHSLLLIRLHEMIKNELQITIPLLDLFAYPTISTLAQRLYSVSIQEIQSAKPEPVPVMASTQPVKPETEIAIIGMAGRFPGAQTLEEFWHNLSSGTESIRWFDRAELLADGSTLEELDHIAFVPAKGIIDTADLFDAAFFGISPREAETIDPQQRILLECAWEALEHAGYQPEQYAERIGVYAGASLNTYLLNNLYHNREHVKKVGMYQIFISNDKDFLTTRLAYKLNLRGPAVTVQTACSTSLVAVHMACQSLLQSECEIALAGGVSIQAPIKEGYIYQNGEVMSPDGHCRAFDAQAQGTVAGTGVGLVVLKRLTHAQRDGDTIYAVIKGSAMNNDGAQRVGFTAPRAEGQAEVISQALRNAGVHPQSISYIETHGTGTTLGDPIEIAGLTQAFRAHEAQQNAYCAIGSVKTNIGHLDVAAGVAGLIKVVLMLQHQQIPPSLHYTQPNPQIDFAHSPFFVNAQLNTWKTQQSPRRAGVSSFGVGGTNAHVIVEEAPSLQMQPTTPQPYQLIVLSAHNQTSLQGNIQRLFRHLQVQSQHLEDVAYTLQVARKAFQQRYAFVCRDTADALLQLEQASKGNVQAEQATETRRVVFLFPGQGAQYVNMARMLYETQSTFRMHVEQCAQLLTVEIGLDLRQVLFPTDEQLDAASTQINETWLTQPALFVIEYALAMLWQSWGVRPAALIGHSIGEYVAACLAGVFTLEDALKIVAARGRMIQHCAKGGMLAVSVSEAAGQVLLEDGVTLAAINGPKSIVLAGPYDALAKVEKKVSAQGLTCRRLHTSHAFHSTMMQPVLEPFAAALKDIHLTAPQIPFLSNITGTWISTTEATDANYWVRHLAAPVRFADGIQTLLSDPQHLFLEVGPGNALSTLTRQALPQGQVPLVFSSLRHPRETTSDCFTLLHALGGLWMHGVPVDWPQVADEQKPRRIALPTYAFDRQCYWVFPPRGRDDDANEYKVDTLNHLTSTHNNEQVESVSATERTDCSIILPRTECEEIIAGVWQDVLGISPLSIEANFIELGGDSLMMAQVANHLREVLALDIPINWLFEYQSIELLARCIEDALTAHLEAANQVEHQARLRS